VPLLFAAVALLLLGVCCCNSLLMHPPLPVSPSLTKADATASKGSSLLFSSLSLSGEPTAAAATAAVATATIRSASCDGLIVGCLFSTCNLYWLNNLPCCQLSSVCIEREWRRAQLLSRVSSRRGSVAARSRRCLPPEARHFSWSCFTSLKVLTYRLNQKEVSESE
jgi:hypothetical protein